jgi:hypothetical protein
MKRAVFCFLFAIPLCAQETQLGAEFRGEETRFGDSCVHPQGGLSFGSISGCAQLLFTDTPLHIAVGSLAPGNDFGAGLALIMHYTPNENWRLFWDFDAVATPNESWRAGAYMTVVLIRHPKIVVRPGGSPGTTHSRLAVEEMPTFHAYAQSISLNKLEYFGLGQGTPLSARSFFGMQQTIVGANVVWPIFNPLALSLFGEANGRFIDIRNSSGQSGAPISQLYTEATAPGLAQQPAFGQATEGIRLNPSLAGGYIRLNYSIGLQEWSGGSRYSFRRFTTDLSHQFPLYRRTRSLAPKSFNGPDNCLQDVNAKTCPPITRNLEGSFDLRFLYTASYTSAGNTVPFYLDPTLGGADINGNILLPSYADYRFRGPDLMLLRASFEHSIYKYPIGVKLMLDEGRVALTHQDLGFNHLAHSYAAGLTVNAGGLPVIDLLFAWGGHEGTHNIAIVNPALLGGSPRPSLY